MAVASDYSSPRRPIPVALFNAIGRSLRRLGHSRPLDVGSLLRHASRKLGNIGTEAFAFEEALSALVDSINHEANLNSLGMAIQRTRLATALTNHLRVERFLANNPQVSEVDLGKIVLIAGLQRTGTTLLQRLLDSHSQVRGISASDALNPIVSDKPRLRERLAPFLAERIISYLAPQFKAVHPVDSSAPEEDVLLLDLCFMSQSAEATMHVPSYSKWLEEQDHTGAYEFFSTLLKIQYLRRPSRIWVLKSPHHLEFLGTFLCVFPNATVVQTHRDPLKTIPSFSSMVCHARSIFSDQVDPKEAARHWLEKIERMVQRSMQSRSMAHHANFVDVHYGDLVDQPLEVLRKIYGNAGVKFDKQDEESALLCLRQNAKDRFGKHVYDLTEFGLNREIVERKLGFYRKHYAIPYE